MADKSNPGSLITGFFISLLTVSFITLKLTGHIDWNWIWILSPLWTPIVAALVVILVLAAILGLISVFVEKE